MAILNKHTVEFKCQTTIVTIVQTVVTSVAAGMMKKEQDL